MWFEGGIPLISSLRSQVRSLQEVSNLFVSRTCSDVRALKCNGDKIRGSWCGSFKGDKGAKKTVGVGSDECKLSRTFECMGMAWELAYTHTLKRWDVDEVKRTYNKYMR